MSRGGPLARLDRVAYLFRPCTRVIGYLYNENDLRNVANVLLHVEHLTRSGGVGQSYRWLERPR